MAPRSWLKVLHIIPENRPAVHRAGRVVITAALIAPLVLALDPHRSISQYTHDHWNAANGFPGGAVNAIAQTSDGDLWIGCQKGLVRFDGLKFRLLSRSDSATFSGAPALDLRTDAEGSLWIRLERLGLTRSRAGKFDEPVRNDESFEVGGIGSATNGDVLFGR